LVPVVGRSGSVGGISIDAGGVVARSTADTTSKLRKVRLAALVPAGSPALASSPLRKISLRGLQDAIRRLQQRGGRYDDELQNLAGLQRAEYLFVDPEHRDIVLAGPAEGWRIDEQGQAVGITGGLPPVQLDDLVVALRTARAAATDRGISCSIDPTETGLKKLRPLLNARAMSDALVSRLERALGEQNITITGVPPGSHFARVLVAADFCMKRLGMGFDPSGIEELPSYLELLQAPSAPPPKNAMPRWWMAPRYETLLKDEHGLAWQLRGTGVQTHSESGYLRPAEGGDAAKDDPLAKKWADAMTANYPALARTIPVFAELRNCMDLAVLAALVVKEDLQAKSGCELSLLLDERQLAVSDYALPGKVDSRASFVKKGSGWILSLSGGVQVDSWSVLERVETTPALTDRHRQAAANRRDHWWWD
jgi:hypothetical protein